MRYFLKLDGENIVGHHTVQTGDYQTQVEAHELVTKCGFYKYKYLDGKLVDLSEVEKDNHPLKKEFDENNKFSKIKNLFVNRAILKDIINYPDIPAKIKARAQARLTDIESQINEKIGV